MSFRAGTYSIDISPDKGIELAGYPHYPRHNTGIHDPLYASCIYLDNGEEKFIAISLDILFYSKKYQKAVRKRIRKDTGVPEENILITCTHTHSGPWASGRLDLEALEKELKPDEGYIKKLEDSIIFAAKTAFKNTFDAYIGTGKGSCGKEAGVGGNRRDPNGVSDPDVMVLGIKDNNGDMRACVINYALHPTFLHADNTLVSADYPGYIRNHIKETYPNSNLLFIQGCSGDQSSRYFRRGQSFKEAKRVGELIGQSARLVLDSIDYTNEVTMVCESEEIELKLRDLPDKETAEAAADMAKKEYDELKANDAPYIEIQNANVKLLGAEDILGYIIIKEQGKKLELYEDEKPAMIQTICINDAIIAAFPGEMFVEYAIKIKGMYPDKDVFVATNSNGCLPGYVYTKEAYHQGGYEVDTSMLSYDMGEDMLQKLFELIEKGDSK